VSMSELVAHISVNTKRFAATRRAFDQEDSGGLGASAETRNASTNNIALGM
jgi:hypothetical protein